jgi:RNA polymerase sigma-70 factor (ECF subfamily)
VTEAAVPDLDDVLVARARTGDESAFRRLVHRHHETLHRWALAMTGDADDADDVEQTALLRAHRALAEYRGIGQFRTWLYPIVRTAAADLLRTRRRRAGLLQAGAARLYDPRITTDAAASLDRDRLTALVLERYRELPDRQREVFALADLQGHTPAEIAAMMELEPVTVRTHLLRARRSIRARILAEHPELVEGLTR